MYVVPSSGSNLLGGSMHALINGEPISTFYMLKMEAFISVTMKFPPNFMPRECVPVM